MEQYYTKVIGTIKQDKIINEVTDLVFMSKNRDYVFKIISSLTNSLIGGFNAYKDIDNYLDNDKRIVNKYWQEAQKIIFDGGNAGWTMCVKEMLEIMSREIENLKSE